MHRLAVLPILCLVLAFDHTTVLAYETIGDDSLAGNYECNITGFMWPDAYDGSLTATTSGTQELDADGKGNWLSGSSQMKTSNDHEPGGELICKFTLKSGSYHISSTGAGTSATHWSLSMTGSSSECNVVIRASAGSQDTDQQLLLMPEQKRLLWTSLTTKSLVVGVCSRQEDR
jgi:hypothetical protein